MKLIPLILLSLSATLLPSGAADIFAPAPKPGAPTSINYPTSAAFLAATRSGEIPEMIKDWSKSRNCDAVGRSVIAILRDEYRVPMPELRHDAASISGLIFANLTKFELDGEKDQRLITSYQHNRQTLSDGLKNPKFMEAFDSVAKAYMTALKESIALKKDADDRRLAAEAEKKRETDLAEQTATIARKTAEQDRRLAEVEKQHQADMVLQKAQESMRQKAAVVDAQIASKNAEEQTKADASRDAMDAVARARQKKLEEVLKSPAYELWQVSLKIETGVKMVAEGNAALDKEDAVEAESGVTNLFLRRAAGEKVVAGRTLVDEAYSRYKKLGGTAPNANEVHAGTDPAKEYR